MKHRINSSFLPMCATFPANLIVSYLIISIISCEVQESRGFSLYNSRDRIFVEIKSNSDRVWLPSVLVSLCPAQSTSRCAPAVRQNKKQRHFNWFRRYPRVHKTTSPSVVFNFFGNLSPIVTVISLASNFYCPLDLFPRSPPSFP